MSNNQPQEGNATVAVEKKTSKIPSMVYLCAGLSALAASACMMCRGRKSTALLVGQWAAPLLIMGLYNKVTTDRPPNHLLNRIIKNYDYE